MCPPASRLDAVAGLLLVVAVTLFGCAPERPPESTEPADLLILGGTVVTMDVDRSVITDGGVAVRVGEIVAVGAADEVRAAWSAAEIIEAGAHDLVIPGLVNGHGHAAMTLLRGVADDLALMDWLQSYIFPAEAAAVTPEFVRTGTELAALEMIRTGTTTFLDMYYYEDVVAEVADRSGLRAILGQTVIDFAVPDHATPQQALESIDEWIDRYADHPRVTVTAAPHAPYTVAPEVLQATVELTRRHGVPVLIHLAETRDEVDQIQERYGVSPTEHLEALGFLGPDVIAAHAIWLDDDDIATLARRQVGVVHNPESNMKLASGPMRVEALHAAGVAVGIGTDGAASNNDLDLFGAMLLAPLLAKHEHGDPTALPAARVVAMATIEGARAIGMAERIGSIEVGKRADLVVLDGDSANLVPRYDPYSHLAYAARGHDVRATLVEGRILYLDGEYRTLEPATIIQAARAQAERVRQAIGDRSR